MPNIKTAKLPFQVNDGRLELMDIVGHLKAHPDLGWSTKKHVTCHVSRSAGPI